MSFERRHLLKWGLLAGAGALWPRRFSVAEDDPAAKERVVVVGAGVAGLACARALARTGRRVVVLEGRDRVGGRVVTSRAWPDMPCDLGASWIQGTRGNPLTALADEWGIETKATNLGDADGYRPNGRRVTDAEGELAESRLKELMAEVDRERAELGAAGLPLALGPVVERLIAGEELEPQGLRDLRQLLTASIENEYAADLAELSLLHYDAAGGYGGKNVVFPKGYDEIPRRLAEGLDVRLKQAVTAIEHGENGVVVHTAAGTHPADRVVVTLPLGVLKKGAVDFRPALPAAKRGAIERLGMGLLNKLWLRFPTAFWGRRESDLIAFVGPQRGAWAETVDFQRVFGKPVLMCFQAGSIARAAEALPDARIVAGAMEWLRSAFGASVPDPVAHQMTRWSADPFTLGSYSYFAKGSSPADADALAAPVGDRLFFAGEADLARPPGHRPRRLRVGPARRRRSARGLGATVGEKYHLKDFFDAGVVRRIAAEIAKVRPKFASRAFVRDACAGLERLELMDRGRHIMAALARHLPEDPAEAIEVLVASLGPPLPATEGHGMAPFYYLPHVLFVAEHGLPCFDVSMRAQHALTQRFSAEFSIRRFLEHAPERTLAQLQRWAQDPSPHVRRLVSEGTRPRLPWAGRLKAFQRDPAPVLRLLERLKDDPHPYVRRSVANSLNDIGKDHPELLVEVATRWLTGASPERRALIRHALRSAVKRGDGAALRALGFGAAGSVGLVRARSCPRAPGSGGTSTSRSRSRTAGARRPTWWSISASTS